MVNEMGGIFDVLLVVFEETISQFRTEGGRARYLSIQMRESGEETMMRKSQTSADRQEFMLEEFLEM